MTYSGRGEMMTRAGVFRRWRVPTERPSRTSYGSVAAPKFAHNRLRNKVRFSAIAPQQLVSDPVNLLNRRKQPGMARHATHRISVLIVDLPKQPSLAEGAIA